MKQKATLKDDKGQICQYFDKPVKNDSVHDSMRRDLTLPEIEQLRKNLAEKLNAYLPLYC